MSNDDNDDDDGKTEELEWKMEEIHWRQILENKLSLVLTNLEKEGNSTKRAKIDHGTKITQIKIEEHIMVRDRKQLLNY